MIGSLIIGVTVERVSYAAGFLVAGASSIAGLTVFIVTERRRVRRGVVSEPSPGVSF